LKTLLEVLPTPKSGYLVLSFLLILSSLLRFSGFFKGVFDFFFVGSKNDGALKDGYSINDWEFMYEDFLTFQ
jgi:hypothetical protein